MFTLRGKNVAGLGPQMNQDMPPFWAVYVTVADADGHDGQGHGRRWHRDHAGRWTCSTPAAWPCSRTRSARSSRSGSRRSTSARELVNEPGTFGWNELATTDLGRTQGLLHVGVRLGPRGRQRRSGAAFTVDGNIVCGAHAAGEGEFPAWSVWFGVDDCDAAVAKVTELGGSVLDATQRHGLRPVRTARRPVRGAVFGVNAERK